MMYEDEIDMEAPSLPLAYDEKEMVLRIRKRRRVYFNTCTNINTLWPKIFGLDITAYSTDSLLDISYIFTYGIS